MQTLLANKDNIFEIKRKVEEKDMSLYNIIEIPNINTVFNILYDLGTFVPRTNKELVRIMAYSLVADDIDNIINYIILPANLNLFNYIPILPVLPLNQLDHMIVKYIVMLVEDNIEIEFENQIIDNINNLKIVTYQYSYLIKFAKLEILLVL